MDNPCGENMDDRKPTSIEGFYIDSAGNVTDENKKPIKSMTEKKTQFKYVVFFNNEKHKKKKRYIHRLLAESFIPNPNKCKYVRHIGDVTDNSLNNIEWYATIKKRDYNSRWVQKRVVNDVEKYIVRWNVDNNGKNSQKSKWFNTKEAAEKFINNGGDTTEIYTKEGDRLTITINGVEAVNIISTGCRAIIN